MKLLIVEDEKLIRQGIHAMAIRSPVSFDDIIQCKNGEEAYGVIKSQKIDIMITDIRMPRMDGITLVKEMQLLSDIPKVVVVSGYDDFSYAVELMRAGAREYLLKPVDRDKLSGILVKLAEEITEEQARQKEIARVSRQQLKYMLLNPDTGEEEAREIENKFRDYFTEGNYVVCCTNDKQESMPEGIPKGREVPENVIVLTEVEEQSVFILKTSELEEFLCEQLNRHYVGVSREHNTLSELTGAFQEALWARKNAFVTGSFIVRYSPAEYDEDRIAEDTLEQYVHLIGTEKLVAANKLLVHILYKAKQGLVSADCFSDAMKLIVDKIVVNYRNVIDLGREESIPFTRVFHFDNAITYYEEFSRWVEGVNSRILKEFADDKNKQKLQEAVCYIRENYHRDLNMAVVSNYISMNYYLFSYAFKQYTGTNFVSYLKTIRVNEAKRLLEETDKKITEISSNVGYGNEKHFMKLFRKVCGVSPSEFRKNIRAGRREEL
jgi:two-component system response regulator YesN